MLDWIVVFSTQEDNTALPQVMSIAGENHNSDSYRNAGATRDDAAHFVFKYTLEGEGAVSDQHGEHLVPEGSALLCQVNDPDICYYYRPGETRTWRFVYITFAGTAATQWASDLARRHGPVHELPISSDIIQRLLTFANTDHQQRLVGPSWGSELASSLLISLERANETSTEESASSYLVRRLQELVSENIEDDLNVKELAAMTGVSREHMSRVFSKHYGTTPHRYILQERMKYAGYLLRHSGKSVKEVAYGLGFESPTHFARTFKRVMHSTPMEFRLRGRS